MHKNVRSVIWPRVADIARMLRHTMSRIAPQILLSATAVFARQLVNLAVPRPQNLLQRERNALYGVLHLARIVVEAESEAQSVAPNIGDDIRV